MKQFLLRWKYEEIIILFCLSLMAIYQGVCFSRGAWGYPLDDAWIHQTYARNLGVYHDWMYFSGNGSNGSTAPLWTALLAVGYVLHIPYMLWSFILGAAFLSVLGIIAYRLGVDALKIDKKYALGMALLLVSEWHLTWAALSGMETLALACVVLLIFWLLSRDVVSWWACGLLIGLSVWLRPDAITLLGPALWVLVFSNDKPYLKILNGLRVLTGLLLFFVPYLGFNQILSGNWWPNTFYAKQSEYALLLQQPWLYRLGVIISQPLIGGGILVLPGWFYLVWKSVKEKSWFLLAMFLWWLGYAIIYASFLPVTYQHGRYEMPAMPLYFIPALAGFIKLVTRYRRKRRFSLWVKTWAISCVAVWLVFIIPGITAYSEDVGIIQNEMVQTSQWISQNTAPDALIGAHDIGALGYFGNRKIIDLAGLITPDVIPFLRDEALLADYLDEQQVDYVMTFPGWYSSLVKDKTIVYQSQSLLSVAAGGENMAVYLWKK